MTRMRRTLLMVAALMIAVCVSASAAQCMLIDTENLKIELTDCTWQDVLLPKMTFDIAVENNTDTNLQLRIIEAYVDGVPVLGESYVYFLQYAPHMTANFSLLPEGTDGSMLRDAEQVTLAAEIVDAGMNTVLYDVMLVVDNPLQLSSGGASASAHVSEPEPTPAPTPAPAPQSGSAPVTKPRPDSVSAPSATPAPGGMVVLDRNGVWAQVNGFSYQEVDGEGRLYMYADIVNNSGFQIHFLLENAVIDGMSVEAHGIENIKSGRTVTASDDMCYFTAKKDGSSAVLKNPQHIEFAIEVSDSEGYTELIAQKVELDLSRSDAEEYASLSKGSRGDDVKRMQQKLIDLGYLNDAADGTYGNNTANAVYAFREAFGLLGSGDDFAADNYMLQCLYNQ